MGKINTWTMENHPPATASVETNGFFYAADVVRYKKFRSSFSIKYCHRGTIQYVMGNQAVDVPAGSFFIVNDGTELECLPCQPGTEALMVFFTKDLLLDVLEVIGNDEYKLLDNAGPPMGSLGFFEHVYCQVNPLKGQLTALLKIGNLANSKISFFY